MQNSSFLLSNEVKSSGFIHIFEEKFRLFVLFLFLLFKEKKVCGFKALYISSSQNKK